MRERIGNADLSVLPKVNISLVLVGLQLMRDMMRVNALDKRMRSNTM